HATPELEGRPGVLCTEIREADESPPPSIFGPKKKFRPVVQRPAPKDTSLHSALMEAIHSAGGRDGLRKTPEPSAEGGPKKLCYVEPESEHSALLAAIRGHRGACRGTDLSPQNSANPIVCCWAHTPCGRSREEPELSRAVQSWAVQRGRVSLCLLVATTHTGSAPGPVVPLLV
ncbi:PREDICTED: protein cordon-bleu-like, partial [Myotis brandtii]|uniref:protein cordon-bleu-like n=1 Tax=Myotis brandtii TaxID=109478 RepID=UPI000703F70B